MTTWQAFAGETGSATTSWSYDAYRGFLNTKRYPDNTGPNYTNTVGGRLWKRVWARNNLTTTYTYNPAGQVTSVKGVKL